METFAGNTSFDSFHPERFVWVQDRILREIIEDEDPYYKILGRYMSKFFTEDLHDEPLN